MAVGIPLMSCAGDLNFPNAMALCAGTLLPDIDHPGSYMGKRNKFISKVANKTRRHAFASFCSIGLCIFRMDQKSLFRSICLFCSFLDFMRVFDAFVRGQLFKRRGQLALAADETQGKIRWQVCILQYWKAERGLDFSGSRMRCSIGIEAGI